MNTNNVPSLSSFPEGFAAGSSSPDRFAGVEATSSGSFADECVLLFVLLGLAGVPVM